ncbi:MAG TPA: DUF3152 domain-containing protein [Actinomycetota bacterium]|nr:DUF3152 domain-containing protein [Actinomycetota bacterium]
MGWWPIYLGALFGLLIGFGGGAGNALLADASRPQNQAVALLPPSAPATPTQLASVTPSPAPSKIPVQKAASPSFLASSGPSQPSKTCGSPGARLIKFRVLVEDGLATTPARFVSDLLSILCDERSWIASGEVRFRYDPEGALLLGLRKPAAAEKRCMQLIGLSVNFYYSCAGYREVVFNSDRWFTGSKYWPGAVPVYRQMLVNHEVGHTLGQHHRGCPKDGAYAPVMMQQSKGLTTGDRTCKPNPWPRPYEINSL